MDLERLHNDDEIDAVLMALRTWIRKVRRPVVRACLEDAHDEIAHLVERDNDHLGGFNAVDVA